MILIYQRAISYEIWETLVGFRVEVMHKSRVVVPKSVIGSDAELIVCNELLADD